jgi:hypothetical protein
MVQYLFCPNIQGRGCFGCESSPEMIIPPCCISNPLDIGLRTACALMYRNRQMEAQIRGSYFGA